MLGSPNLYRGNAPLAMRLRIDDLRAQLAPLDLYGLTGLSSAVTGGVRAFVCGLRSPLLGVRSMLRGAVCSALNGGRDCEAV